MSQQDIRRMSKEELDALNELGRQYKRSQKPVKVLEPKKELRPNDRPKSTAKTSPKRKTSTIGAEQLDLL